MPLIVAETFLEGCLSVNVISAPDVRRVPAEYKIGVKKTEQISRRIIGSLPSVSFKLRKLHSETAGRTPDIPRKCLIPTAGFLSGWHLDKFVRMVLGLPKNFKILSGCMESKTGLLKILVAVDDC